MSGGRRDPPVDFPGAVLTQLHGIGPDGDIVGSYRTTGDANPSGTVVGLFEDWTSATHGYARQGTTFTTIDCPGATSTMSLEVNAAGDLVGAAMDGAGVQQGFVARRP